MFNLLLIDDDPNIVDGIDTIIRNNFPGIFSVTKAYDGQQALALLTENYFHIIVSDIKMPQLDGIQLLELLHDETITSTTIMLSGYDDYMYIRNALKLGAYDYLLKPVNIQNFIDMLHSIIPMLPEGGQTLSKTNLAAVPRQDRANDYFDLANSDNIYLTPEQVKEELQKLQILIFELDDDEVCGKINYIFHHLSEDSVSKERFRQLLSDFLYSLMQHNSSLIKIVAQYKLTDNDLAAHIKSLPCLSQLKEKFTQVLLLYIDQLAVLKKNNDEYLIKKAQAYIDKHYSEQLLLADIAAQFRLHPNYFSFLFKKYMNITVREYILQLRINTAKELMKDPSLKLLDIALAVGYQDAAHFNRAFKNVTGVAPSQYRNGVEIEN